jgi:hypothetical protein
LKLTPFDHLASHNPRPTAPLKRDQTFETMTSASRLQEPLEGLACIYAEKLLEQTGEEPFPTAKIIDLSFISFPDSPEDFLSEWGVAAQLSPLEATIGPISGKLKAVTVQYTAFFTKFDAQSEDGKLDNAKCVGFAWQIRHREHPRGESESSASAQAGGERKRTRGL